MAQPLAGRVERAECLVPNTPTPAIDLITQLGVAGALLIVVFILYRAWMAEREERIATQGRYEELQSETRTFLRETLAELNAALSAVKDHMDRR